MSGTCVTIEGVIHHHRLYQHVATVDASGMLAFEVTVVLPIRPGACVSR